jgi:hypothetical protein
MNTHTALHELLKHNDPEVRTAAVIIRDTKLRHKGILDEVREAIQQLRLDVKYMSFDLECTRKERDTLKTELEGKA